MALERSVLTEQIITELVHKYYGIKLQAIQRMKLGSANCYDVSDGKNRYFLKEFQSKFSFDDLIREASAVNFLAAHDFPTYRIYLTYDNAVGLMHEGHLICLESFIDGISFDYNNFPEQMLPELAATLGRLHTVLAKSSVSLPVDMDRKWIDSFSAVGASAKCDKLLEELHRRPNDPHYSRIAEDLIYKKELFTRIATLQRHFETVTYAPTHGDYQGCQCISDGTKITAVIDFSSVRILPIVWEIMRSFVQTSYCRKNAKIDIEGLCAYVQEYLRFSSLRKSDLAAMPYVYLYQLARSLFGYPQYLTSESEDRLELLDFAFWRTAMCRELENNMEKISDALTNLL